MKVSEKINDWCIKHRVALALIVYILALGMIRDIHIYYTIVITFIGFIAFVVFEIYVNIVYEERMRQKDD
ncbi:MAG: hypothetical protein R6U96_18585 [Promethearchaeia archaeon]